MSERADPDHPSFKPWRIVLRKKPFPMPWLKINPFYKAFLKRYRSARPYINSKKVLDIPCGVGWGTSLLKNAESVIGVDIDEASVEKAKAKYSSRKRCFQAGSMERLEFADGEFDVVVCFEGIEHVPEEVADAFFLESHRVLKAGGVLLLTSPHCEKGQHSGNEYHIKEYQYDDIVEKFEKLFKIEHHSSYNAGKMTVDYFVLVRKM